MLCLNTVADVFCHNFWQIVLYIVVYFGPHFVMADVIANMLWLMLLLYMNVVADVMPLMITLVAIKLNEIG